MVALIFFFAVLIGTWSFRPEFGGNGPHLFTSLIVNGSSSDFVPYPEITICPLWEAGMISNVRCYEGGRSANGTRTGGPLLTKIIGGGSKAKHPAWNCTTVNYNGAVPSSADMRVFCEVNSTNYGSFGNSTTDIAWPGRVIVVVHTPGQYPEHCDNCYDGANFAIVEFNTTGFIGFGAHVYDLSNNKSIEYRTTHSSITKPLSLAAVETSDMDFALYYYTPDVLVYREPQVLAAAIGGERFGQFITLVGGVGIFSYILFACLKTTLILLLLGKDSLSTGERQPMI